MLSLFRFLKKNNFLDKNLPYKRLCIWYTIKGKSIKNYSIESYRYYNLNNKEHFPSITKTSRTLQGREIIQAIHKIGTQHFKHKILYKDKS